MGPSSLMGFQSWLEAGPARRVVLTTRAGPAPARRSAVARPSSHSRGTGWFAAKIPCGSTALRMPVSCATRRRRTPLRGSTGFSAKFRYFRPLAYGASAPVSRMASA